MSPALTLNDLSLFFCNNVNRRLIVIRVKLNACRNLNTGLEKEFRFFVKGNTFMRCDFVIKVHASRRIVVMLLSFCREENLRTIKTHAVNPRTVKRVGMWKTRQQNTVRGTIKRQNGFVSFDLCFYSG